MAGTSNCTVPGIKKFMLPLLLTMSCLGTCGCMLYLRLIVPGHKEICAARSLRYVLARGNVCCFTSLSGHKEICAAPSHRYIWTQRNILCVNTELPPAVTGSPVVLDIVHRLCLILPRRFESWTFFLAEKNEKDSYVLSLFERASLCYRQRE